MSTPASVRALELHLLAYRQAWRGTIITSFITPLLFLTAMGLGLGSLIDEGNRADLGDLSYVAFLAPGLLAFTAMQTGAFESAWPVLGALKWVRTYQAQIATPLRPQDVGVGQLLFITLRIFIAATVFFAVMLVFGTIESPLAPLAIPAALLTGLAFATPMVAFAVTRQSEQGFSAIFRFVVTPLFLFSGTFFPISQLPAGIRWIAFVTPLWHGVALCRGLTLGTIHALPALGHVAALLAFAGAGLAIALRAYNRVLTP